MQYRRNDTVLTRGTFRVKGEVLEIWPAYAETAYRIQLFGDEVEGIQHFDPLTGEILDEDRPRLGLAGDPLRDQGGDDRARGRARSATSSNERVNELWESGQGARGAPAAPAHRVRHRDAAASSASAPGSRTTRGSSTTGPPGSPPHTLIDYFPDDFVVFVDESHQTIPQIGGMYEGDRSRKTTLVDHGFRLPSAIDNRPLQVRRVHRPGSASS